MSKTKTFLILCGMLTFIGIVLAGAGYLLGGRVTGVGINSAGFQVFTLESKKDSTLTRTIAAQELDNFSDINFNVSFCDVIVEESDRLELKMHLPKKYEADWEVKDGVLNLTQKTPIYEGSDVTHWFMWGYNPSFYENDSYICLYLPAGTNLQNVNLISESGNTSLDGLSAESLKLKNAYGSIKLRDMDSGELSLSTESGKISLDGITAMSIELDDDYGDIDLNDVSSSSSLTADMSSGSLRMDDVSAQNAVLNNEYGEIAGSSLTIGSASLVLSGGDCRLTGYTFRNVDIHNSYGSVEIRSTESLSAYGLDLFTAYGDISLEGRSKGDSYLSQQDNSDNRIRVICESGDILLSTENPY